MATFDPSQYKVTTRQQWEEAAGAWHRWGPTLEAWLGDATERMLDAASVGPGSRVLDVAAGAGGQTIARRPAGRARRPGPRHRHLPDDPHLRRQGGRRSGPDSVETLEADGEALDVLDRRLVRCRRLAAWA